MLQRGQNMLFHLVTRSYRASYSIIWYYYLMWIVQALAGTSLLVALGVVWLRWKIETDYKLEFEKHGDYGLSTGEDIVELKGVNFNGKVSIVTGVSWRFICKYIYFMSPRPQ